MSNYLNIILLLLITSCNVCKMNTGVLNQINMKLSVSSYKVSKPDRTLKINVEIKNKSDTCVYILNYPNFSTEAPCTFLLVVLKS